MNARLLHLVAGMLVATSSPAIAGVIYSSVPDFFNATPDDYWCSDCDGAGYEPLDRFTLDHAASISGYNMSAFNVSGYSATVPVTFEIYDATHTTILFSQAVNPTFLTEFEEGSYLVVTAPLSGLHLDAGTYWLGVIGSHYLVASVNSGGNGSLIDTVPHTGVQNQVLGGNIGYQLLSPVPEPVSWTLMTVGFAIAGAGLRRHRRSAEQNCFTEHGMPA